MQVWTQMKLKIRIFFHLFSTNLMLVIAVPDFFKEKQNANEIYLVKLRSAYFFQNNPIFWYYRQYCLITGLYMLEPWEQSLFNCVIFAVCAFVEILLKAVGDAPILKQNKWTVDEKKTVAELCIFLRSYMKVTAYFSVMPICIISSRIADTFLIRNHDEYFYSSHILILQRFQLNDSDSLLLFINQCFAPSPDQTVRNLKDCFAPGDSKLVINYSKAQAWG
ncbi:unnamed protein product [Brugia timori]|uniref:Ubiquitin-like protein ATG12 n=1 Tax=Brugia timori TaxID=42155 RepID=A0A0R3Q4N8_9BILA|nr:unnamed protein product [Brugia timori]